MPQPVPYPHSTWFFKFCECLLAAVAVTSTVMMVMETVPRSFRETHEVFEEYILPFIYIIIPLLSAVLFSIVWHRRERAGRVDSGLRHAWLQGIIRYWLALSISTYGFAKILKTQFDTPSYRLDMPMGDVNGFGLTWYYFGYSYTLAVIIALFQIGGSILLLYRRTTLLGVMILLPVMVNIVFINLFFSIAPGAFFNSVIFTLGLTFLLLLDINKLKAAFWDLMERLPPINMGGNWGKHGLRFLPIVAAFSLVLFLVRTNENETVLKGTWKVVNMARNGQMLQSDAWLADTTAYNRIYFAGWYGCVFSPNPYRYRPAESLRGTYKFDSTKNTLRLMIFQSDTAKVPDTIQLAVSNRTAKSMRLQGVFYRDTVDMSLVRLR